MIIFMNKIGTGSIFIIMATLMFYLLFEEHITDRFFFKYSECSIKILLVIYKTKTVNFLIISRYNAKIFFVCVNVSV